MDARWWTPGDLRSLLARMEGQAPPWGEVPWGALPPQVLTRFLQLRVLIPRAETSEALQQGVLPEVERVLAVAHRLEDARFGPHFLRSGSYIEGLKVSEPDEFDFLVPLNGLDEKSFTLDWSPVPLPEGRPDGSFLAVTLWGPCYNRDCGTCGTRGKRTPADLCSWRQLDVADRLTSWAWPLNVSGFFESSQKYLLNPHKVMSTFKQSVSKTLQREPGKVTVQRLQPETPAVTFSVPHEQMNINVDLVPFIRNPFSLWNIPWPRPDQFWLSQEKIREIQHTGVDLVAKHKLYWRYSFSRIERILLEKIDEDGGHRRNSLRILKKVREDRWKGKHPKALVSYHLKTVLFWACEVYPSFSDWKDLTMSFKRLVDLLIISLSARLLPHYFLGPNVNLFKADVSVLEEVLENVVKFRSSPEKYLQSKD